TGEVGIGTQNPSNRLTVAQEADSNAIIAINSGLTAAQFSTLRLNDRGTAYWAVSKNPSNDFSIREIGPGTDRLYIAQGGNVGIGTSSPGVRLDVQGSASGNVMKVTNSNTSGNSLYAQLGSAAPSFPYNFNAAIRGDTTGASRYGVLGVTDTEAGVSP